MLNYVASETVTISTIAERHHFPHESDPWLRERILRGVL